jgi:hypothetical protein
VSQPLSTRAKVLLAVGGTILVLGMLATAVFNYLLAPPKGTLVVLLEPEAGQVARAALKADCGGLPGIKVVADQGNPDPEVQGRFPVRFDIGSASAQEETALQTCIARHEHVRGVRTEGAR